jgi:hypothetical protein
LFQPYLCSYTSANPLFTIWRHGGRRRSLAQVGGSYRIVRRLISAGAVAALWCCTFRVVGSSDHLSTRCACAVEQVVYLAISVHECVGRRSLVAVGVTSTRWAATSSPVFLAALGTSRAIRGTSQPLDSRHKCRVSLVTLSTQSPRVPRGAAGSPTRSGSLQFAPRFQDGMP